jgi:hypothetical protein
MSLNRYEWMQAKFERTVPIRGRAVECRPIGDRRRDWEQIVKTLTPLGEGYSARLYDTDCVTVAPNGDMYVQIDRWATPITAQWIQRYTGLACYKKYNEIWIDVDGRTIPIARGEKLHLKFKGADVVNVRNQDKYTCDKEVVREQKVIDRSKSKEARVKVKAFKEYAQVMMRLCDGKVTHEMQQEHRKAGEYGWGNNYHYEILGETVRGWDLARFMGDSMSKKLYELMQRVMVEGTDEEKFRLMLCVMDTCQVDSQVYRGQEEITWVWDGKQQTGNRTVYDYLYARDAVVRKIDYIVSKACDIYTTKTVKVDKPMCNLT